MHLSQYVKNYPWPERPGYRLLYSTRRSSTVLVPEGVLERLDRGDVSPAEEETLTRLGFLVPDPQAEREEMQGIMEEGDRRRKGLSAIVVMTLDCNLACPYCYEGGGKGKRYLSEETANLLVDFLEREALTRGKDVFLTFHGGEPLLNLPLIREISRQVRGVAAEVGLSYAFSLVTNGTLLDRKNVEELVPLGLKRAKFTLDGPREIHDRFRPFVSGKGSFDLIIRNIREVWDLIQVQIGGNFTRENWREFPRLLDFLVEEGITPDKVQRLQFAPVTGTAGDMPLPDFNDGCTSANEPWVMEASLYLREEIMRRGFSTPPLAMAACMVESANDIVVNHDGRLYKCPAFINWEGMAVGDLRSGIGDCRAFHNLGAWQCEECLECAYLPLCFGGCKFLQMVRDGRIEGVDCKKEFFDATLEAFIRQEIQYR